MLDWKAERDQSGQGIHKRTEFTGFRMVGVEGAMGALFENSNGESRQCSFRPALHKDSCPVFVHALHLSSPFHRGGDLPGQVFNGDFCRSLAGWVPAGCHIGCDGSFGGLYLQAFENLLQRAACWRNNAGVECVGHRQWVDGDPATLEGLAGGFNGIGCPGNNSLGWAVLVGCDNVALDLGQHFFNHFC